MTSTIDAKTAIDEVSQVVAGLPVFLTGSSVSALWNPTVPDTSFDDVDVFCATPQAIIAAAQKLQHAGFTLPDRFGRVWHRWLKYGFNQWHTNSLKLVRNYGGTSELKVNLVYKLVDKHPTTSLMQVIESFDFGLLHTGLDIETMKWRDASDYLFPGLPRFGALPLMPNKQDNWEQGFISQYNGLREVGRYVKYVDYGYDMSAVKDTLVKGYNQIADYKFDRSETLDDEHDKLGKIYQAIAIKMEDDDFDSMRAAGAEILFLDDLDKIMEALD